MHELIYTSAQNTFDGAGYGVVGRTANFPTTVEAMIRQRLNQYDFVGGANSARPHAVFSCVALREGMHVWKVLSRVGHGGVDYTNREVFFAHHVAVRDDELGDMNPAALMLAPGFFQTSMNGRTGNLAQRSLPVPPVISPQGDSWRGVAGDSQWATAWCGQSLESQGKLPQFLLVSENADLLRLFAEAAAMLPAATLRRLTFLTDLTSERRGLDVDWVGLRGDSETARQVAQSAGERLLDIRVARKITPAATQYIKLFQASTRPMLAAKVAPLAPSHGFDNGFESSAERPKIDSFRNNSFFSPPTSLATNPLPPELEAPIPTSAPPPPPVPPPASPQPRSPIVGHLLSAALSAAIVATIAIFLWFDKTAQMKRDFATEAEDAKKNVTTTVGAAVEQTKLEAEKSAKDNLDKTIKEMVAAHAKEIRELGDAKQAVVDRANALQTQLNIAAGNQNANLSNNENPPTGNVPPQREKPKERDQDKPHTSETKKNEVKPNAVTFVEKGILELEKMNPDNEWYTLWTPPKPIKEPVKLNLVNPTNIDIDLKIDEKDESLGEIILKEEKPRSVGRLRWHEGKLQWQRVSSDKKTTIDSAKDISRLQLCLLEIKSSARYKELIGFTPSLPAICTKSVAKDYKIKIKSDQENFFNQYFQDCCDLKQISWQSTRLMLLFPKSAPFKLDLGKDRVNVRLNKFSIEIPDLTPDRKTCTLTIIPKSEDKSKNEDFAHDFPPYLIHSEIQFLKKSDTEGTNENPRDNLLKTTLQQFGGIHGSFYIHPDPKASDQTSYEILRFGSQ